MTSLNDAIGRFQQEIGRALAARVQLTAGLVWEVERVALSLDVIVVPAAPEGQILCLRSARDETTQGEHGHTVRIEFRVRPEAAGGWGEAGPAPAALSPESRPVALTPLRPEGSDDQTVAEMTELLGSPGFNSSARAAVFCDAVRGLTAAQASAAVAALSRPAAEVEDEAVRQARHLIRGIVQSGPLKSADRAAALLSGLFQARPLASLVALVQAHWSTEKNW